MFSHFVEKSQTIGRWGRGSFEVMQAVPWSQCECRGWSHVTHVAPCLLPRLSTEAASSLPPYTRSICVFTTADGLQMCPLPWAVLLGAQLPAGQPCLGDSWGLQPPCVSTCCRRWPLIQHMCTLSVYSAGPQCSFTQPQRALRVQTRFRLRASDTFSL